MSERKEWRPVCGYEGRYEVSEYGDIRSLVCKGGMRSKPRPLKHCVTDRGYHYVSLCKGSTKHRGMRVHRIVAAAFLDNPDGLDQVNHKNRNKSDNHYSNLEWCNAQQNCEHAHAKAYRAISPDGKTVEFFNMSKFCRENGVSIGGMHGVISGKNSMCKGWRKANE